LHLQNIFDEIDRLAYRAQNVLGEYQANLPIVTALVDSQSVLTPEHQPELRSHSTDT